MTFSVFFDEWVRQESNKLLKSKRTYRHFDNRIRLSSSNEWLRAKLTPEEISKHAFYPLINAAIITPRYKKDKDGRRFKEVKLRPIAYASHFDSLIYSYYAYGLGELYENYIRENGFYESVLAYLKKGKSNINFSYEVFSQIVEYGDCVAIALDVKGFFDNLDHEILKKNWTKICRESVLPDDHYNVLKSLTKFSMVDKEYLERLFPDKNNLNRSGRYCSPKEFREVVRKSGNIKVNDNRNQIKTSGRFNELSGIPQGTPISAVLSNIYMIDFDFELSSYAKLNNMIYRRYCDDILLVCRKSDCEGAMTFISDLMSKAELKINEDKTVITEFRSDVHGHFYAFNPSCNRQSKLQYLGFEFDGHRIYVRSSSISRYKRRLKSALKKGHKASMGKNSKSDLIFRRKLYKRFGVAGNRNFLQYMIRAKRVMEGSPSLKRQYKKCLAKLFRISKNYSTKQ